MPEGSRSTTSSSTEETIELGRELGLSQRTRKNLIFCLYGELGAGKTTFAKGLVAGLACISPDEVASPTFVYLNVYDHVYHFDLYRLKDSEAFLAMGFDEYLDAGGICCIEWAERITDLLPPEAVAIRLSHVNETTRHIEYEL